MRSSPTAAGRVAAPACERVRAGGYLVCIDRKIGDCPIKVFTVDVGLRRPVGVGGGGIAVLASMPEKQAAAAFGAVKGRLGAYS
jgi:DNA-binding IclR family transcriptional regulator